MANKNVVITRVVPMGSISDPLVTQFWTGKRWSKEYPDAAQYTHAGARKEARAQTLDTGPSVTLWFNYGSADETTEPL